MARQPRSQDEADGQWREGGRLFKPFKRPWHLFENIKIKIRKQRPYWEKKPSSNFNALPYKMINKY